MVVQFMHMPRPRYGEEGGQYMDDYRGGGGHGGASSSRQIHHMMSSNMDSLASTMSFMERQIRCRSRSCARRVARLLERGVGKSSRSASRSGREGNGGTGGVVVGGSEARSLLLSVKKVRRKRPKISRQEEAGEGKEANEPGSNNEEEDGRLPTVSSTTTSTTPRRRDARSESSREGNSFVASPGGSLLNSPVNSPARPG